MELKGSVFKKFDKNNLFQVSCSDVRERFHLAVLLFVVTLQTMKEYSWKAERFWVLLPDCVMVLLAEICVDWLKHAFITRFNELQLDVYRDYRTSLAYDMVQTRQKHAFSDHSDLVARRMGFIPLPLAVVMIRVVAQSVHIEDIPSVIIAIVAYFCLVSFRVLNSIFILGMACNLITQHKMEKASVQSPLANRASSPVTPASSKIGIPKDLFKDIATSPLKPVTDQPNRFLQSNGTSECFKTMELNTPPDLSLGSTAIFSNSTVDLKNVSLNEELLKIDGDDIQIEDVPEHEEIFTRSEPNINSEYVEETKDLEQNLIECNLKKRAESEPSLNICNEGGDSNN